MKKTTRRTFIKAAGTTSAGVLLAGLPRGWTGGVYASDAPETAAVNVGIIASPTARHRHRARARYFKKFGIQSTISKEASWAVIRDKLSLGRTRPRTCCSACLASTMGLGGSP